MIEHSIAALVAQPGQLKVSLLGMSFLNRLQSWEVRGDRLLLPGIRKRAAAASPEQVDDKAQRNQKEKAAERHFQPPPRERDAPAARHKAR